MAFFTGVTEQGKYVQSVVAENAAAVRCLLLERRGQCFVCGGGAMARGVRCAMQTALGGEDALFELMRAGQYVEESWG